MMLNKVILFAVVLTLGVRVQADFLHSETVGPDVIFHQAFLSQGPWRIQILEIDLENPHVKLETVKANDQLWGYERTSSMASRKDAEAHRVVGAINADFFASGGIPIGAQVINGDLLKREYPRSVFGVGPSNEPFIDILNFNGGVSKGLNQISVLNTVNATRDADQLVLYNRLFGTSTGTNNWGTEVSCLWVDAPLVNATRRAIVTLKDSTLAPGSGNNDIPDNGFVLSGHGLARLALDSTVFVGDTLEVLLSFSPIEHPISQLVGGTPRLIRDGVVSVEWEQEGVGSSFSYDRHPRTAVGFSADSSKAYFFTVDGRQPGYSVGMSLFELANYMLNWNVAQGVNLDGGGSTTMVVRGEVKNSPSDGTGERTVANALMVVNTAPTGNLTILDVLPRSFHTLVETSQEMELQGFDSTYNPVDVPLDGRQWSCSPEIGAIDGQGLFVAGDTPGTGFIVCQIEGLVDTAWVTVTRVDSIALSPEPVILEMNQHQQMQARAYDDQGNLLNLSNGEFDWWVTPALGAINNLGYFSAYHFGSGMIRARYGDVGDSVVVSVGSSQAVTIDDFSDTDNWELSALVANMDLCDLTADASNYVSPPTAGRLDYSFMTGGTSVLYLNGEIPISGSPDQVFIDIFGDGAGHWLRGEFRCASGDLFLVNFTEVDPGIDWSGSWQTLQVDLTSASAHWGNPNAILNYPITWTKLYLAEPDDANKNTGFIFLDNFGVSYLTTEIHHVQTTPGGFQLAGPYPNPFNSTTTFEFRLHQAGLLELKIYDLQGRSVYGARADVNEGVFHYTWQTDGLPTGIYLYQATLGGDTLIGKCLLLK